MVLEQLYKMFIEAALHFQFKFGYQLFHFIYVDVQMQELVQMFNFIR